MVAELLVGAVMSSVVREAPEPSDATLEALVPRRLVH